MNQDKKNNTSLNKNEFFCFDLSVYVQASSFLVSSVISFQPHVITLILLESTLVCVIWFLTVQRVREKFKDEFRASA